MASRTRPFPLLLASLTTLAITLHAQAPSKPAPEAFGPKLTQLPPGAVRLTGRAGLHPWRDGLLGFGDHYRAAFTRQGMRFSPHLAMAPTEQPLLLRPLTVMRGEHNVCELRPVEPRHSEQTVEYRRTPGICERYDITADHVELSWSFAERPAGDGDLVVRYALDTQLPAPTPTGSGGLELQQPGIGGVTIGAVTGIDADGATSPGTLRYVDGELELRLPAAFVDEAAYPLVLDPAIGPAQPIPVGSFLILQDAAYDAASDRFLVLYFVLSSFATGGVIRGQFVDSSGALIGAPFQLGPLGSFEARVANLATEGLFGVTWRRGLAAGAGNAVELTTVPATNSAGAQTMMLDQSPTGSIERVDIGCDTTAPAGSGRGFVVVYDDQGAGEIRARKVYVDSAGQLVAPPATTLLADATGIDYSEPRISKAGAERTDLLLVYRRETTSSNNADLTMRILHSDTLSFGASSTYTEVGGIREPEVDGYGGHWVVTWVRVPNPFGASTVEVMSVLADGAALAQGPRETWTGSLQTLQPSVAYAPGRTWLTYQDFAFPCAHVRAIDSRACANCNDSLDFPTNETIIVAGTTSGGAPQGEHAILGWDDGSSAFVRMLRNYGGGQVQNLGGGCGNGGNAAVAHAPGIGSSGVDCSVDGLPSSTLTTVFNLAPSQPTVACGPCVWTPFTATAQPPIIAGRAEVRFPIPCLLALVGTQLETQWTSLDLTQTACPLLPGLVLSDRLLLTVGN